jgi:triosephosphate isomerase (TIM)
MKKKIFAANWKLNKTPAESKSFFANLLPKISADFLKSRDLIFFPQNFSLETTSQMLHSSHIGFGPQNIYYGNSGAFTGENSAEVAKKMNCQFVLVGHSERRQLFSETDEALCKKIKTVQDLDLTAVFCIGETLKEREDGKTGLVCSEQLAEGLKLADKNKRLIVAYEPVWAIGTGKVATLDQVKEAHEMIHNFLASHLFADYQILYGGSVKPDNAKDLLNIRYVDGFLVGGASLEVDSFLKICQP